MASGDLWRGDLSPLGREAALEAAIAAYQIHREQRFYDCFAAERG